MRNQKLSKAELLYKYPLYSIKRIPVFLKYAYQHSKLIAAENTGNCFTVFMDIIWCNWRYGAMDSRDYWLFDFYTKSSSERDKYFTKRRYFKLIKQFDFETFSFLLVKENAYRKYASFIKRDWMLADKNTCVADITTFIDKYGVVLVKPNSGEQGGGIFKASRDDLSQIQSLLEYNELLLEQVVVNCSEISRINPSSLNTFRIYTLVDRNGIPRIIAIMLRAGAAGKAVDNWGSGGVGYSFDVDSGVCVGYGYDKKHNRYIFHPGSEFIMAGFSIPRYEEFTEFVLALAKVESKARYVGWDIAITPDGFELIEMNFPGGHDFLQAFGVPAYPLIQKYW